MTIKYNGNLSLRARGHKNDLEGYDKIYMIKTIRGMFGLSLYDAKLLAENLFDLPIIQTVQVPTDICYDVNDVRQHPDFPYLNKYVEIISASNNAIESYVTQLKALMNAAVECRRFDDAKQLIDLISRC